MSKGQKGVSEHYQSSSRNLVERLEAEVASLTQALEAKEELRDHEAFEGEYAGQQISQTKNVLSPHT